MNGLKVKLMSNTPNLASMYEAYANGTLEEYCTEHDLDFVLLNIMLRELPNAVAYSFIHGEPDYDKFMEKKKRVNQR